MKTVFITGASSGIGRSTAMLFQSKGWNVIATMRQPDKEQELNKLANVLVLHCDVTDHESIRSAVKVGLNTFKTIDVLVNNAGYYSIGTLESVELEEISRQVDTNLIGLIKMTREIIPIFRQQKSGVIINLSSIAGVISVPLQTLYHASKWGVEGFSESLQYELMPFNIKVKIIEPGVIKTDFFGRSMTLSRNAELIEYTDYEKKVLNNLSKNNEKASDPSGVAETIFTAATDNKWKLRYPTGKSKSMVQFKKLLPFPIYQFFTKKTMEK